MANKNKKMFFAELKFFDEVVLVDREEKWPLEYCEIIKCLGKEGVAVRNEVLISQKFDELISSAQALHPEEKKKDLVPRQFYFYLKESAASLEEAQASATQLLKEPVSTASTEKKPINTKLAGRTSSGLFGPPKIVNRSECYNLFNKGFKI